MVIEGFLKSDRNFGILEFRSKGVWTNDSYSHALALVLLFKQSCERNSARNKKRPATSRAFRGLRT